MGMIFFLISLYLLNANGVVVPNGCFIAVWGFTIFSSLLSIISAIVKAFSDKNN
jgi:hypothetical protein